MATNRVPAGFPAVSQADSKAAHRVCPGEPQGEGTAGRNRSWSVQGGSFSSGANTPIKIGRHPNPFFRFL